ncbi:hypothetical protein HU200_003718 [Digitaria exilis]|uniref:NB-ARC domain-containing protein n=1 Tax=Digitaria exilis TaxID=1010633 RepID=A0A835FX80_9POAL|nr:hypothetical protein HU200_003718 [Digitaria exilis]
MAAPLRQLLVQAHLVVGVAVERGHGVVVVVLAVDVMDGEPAVQLGILSNTLVASRLGRGKTSNTLWATAMAAGSGRTCSRRSSPAGCRQLRGGLGSATVASWRRSCSPTRRRLGSARSLSCRAGVVSGGGLVLRLLGAMASALLLLGSAQRRGELPLVAADGRDGVLLLVVVVIGGTSKSCWWLAGPSEKEREVVACWCFGWKKNREEDECAAAAGRKRKELRDVTAKVEDVSQRNVRYRLIKGSAGSKTAAVEQSDAIAAAIFGVDEARRAAKHDNQRVDLVQLISMEDDNLKVIAVWGTSGDIGQTTIIRAAYESPDIQNKFLCRAWVRVMHPFNPKDFVQSLVNQLHGAQGVEALLEKQKTEHGLAQEFNGYVDDRRFLIVLNDLSTIEEWDQIIKCFPNNKKGSRIIVSTAQVEIASLCAGQQSQASELEQLSVDQTLYAFYDKVISTVPTEHSIASKLQFNYIFR